jgi:hypothetical protein
MAPEQSRPEGPVIKCQQVKNDESGKHGHFTRGKIHDLRCFINDDDRQTKKTVAGSHRQSFNQQLFERHIFPLFHPVFRF